MPPSSTPRSFPGFAGVAIGALFLASCAAQPVDLARPSADAAAASLYDTARRALYEATSRTEYPRAVELLEQAVEADPENASARLNLVYAYTKLGRYAAAAPHLTAATQMAEHLNTREKMWLAALVERVADRPEAEIVRWQGLVAAYPDDRWAWYELASANAAIEQYADAASAAGRAAALEPDPRKWGASWLYYLHSKALFRSGQYPEAIAAAEPGRATPDTWRSTFYRMALARAKADPSLDLEPLVEEYRRIAREEGRTEPSFLEANIALLHFEAGDYAEAAASAREALAIRDGSYPTWVLGYSLAEMGQAQEAVMLLESAKHKFADEALIRAAYGWALLRAGRSQEARDALREAVAMSERRNFRIERELKAVEDFLADPATGQPPRLGWID